MKDSERETTVLEYCLFGFFSIVPLLGFLVGVIAIILGLTRVKKGGWKLALLGLAGLLLSNMCLHAVNRKFVSRNLHRCVTAIEFYKQVHGQYPKNIEDLLEGDLGGLHSDSLLIRDNTQGVFFVKKYFFYQLTEDGFGYNLFSVGPDGKPFTADDIYPDLIPDEEKHSGYRKKN